jgi:serine/threonine-protein kinase
VATTDYSGRTFDGRYRVERLLGKGGMGSVYMGRHVLVGRKVAIKILHAEFAGDAEMVVRFYREARAAAAIGHKNIIDVLDVGTTEESDPYLVMEYLEGESLRSMLKRTGPIELAAACGIMEPVLQALSAAHQAGIIHRDLKPDNIFLVSHSEEETEVKLIDFGISKFTQDVQKTDLTQTGQLIGTPAYMSPEQAQGDGTIDQRTDVYALGVIFYQMLTGKLPYQGKAYAAVIGDILTGKPVPPLDANPDFPREAEGVVLRAMSKKPDDRYASADEMLEMVRHLKGFAARRERLGVLASGVMAPTFPAGDLGAEKSGTSDLVGTPQEVLAKIAAEQTPTGWSKTSAQVGKRKPWTLAIAGGLIAALVVVIVVLVIGNGGAEPAATPAEVEPAAESGETERIYEAVDESDESVTITVVGMPDGAKIYYDGALVPMNPFRARSADAVVPLKVEAEGFEPFSIAVIPSEDRRIEAELKPEAEESADAGPADDGEAEGPKAPKKKGKVKTTPKEREKGKFLEKFE